MSRQHLIFRVSAEVYKTARELQNEHRSVHDAYEDAREWASEYFCRLDDEKQMFWLEVAELIAWEHEPPGPEEILLIQDKSPTVWVG